ncbi:NADH-quinone oxidoreductase subunit B family protein [Methanospirillum stamsii]|uniref:Formate hydrogenlyase n=1 Tax=Methanospirillum stamsii TaxID=1277351 RepID=A0A2V2N1B8_9EURY|nr:NADH-quinone oxidoreductase subunit B family protein [Methanospirillum stamsii]PWR72440.1 formate hydrogenlyase [Methanospirillum stamsii]
MNLLSFLLKKPEDVQAYTPGPAFESAGHSLRQEIDRVFGHSIAIREVDCGSDNAAEIELANLSAPHYDVERFGITFVASPRHADILAVTGVVTHGMKEALLKTYEATPEPKFVIAVGDDACTGGMYAGTYATLGPVDAVLPVDLKIPGNPPTPVAIMEGMLGLMKSTKKR